LAEAVLGHQDVTPRALLVGLSLALASPAHADTCLDPRSQFMTFVCADPELRTRRDKEVLNAKAALALIPDARIRAMIAADAAAERAALLTWDLSSTLKILETDPDLVAQIGQERMRTFDGPPPTPHEVLRYLVGQYISDQPQDNSWLVEHAEAMVAFRRDFLKGKFSGDTLDCGFLPPLDWVRSDLFCVGTIRVQNGGRVCGIVTHWASGHFYSYFVAADVEGRQLKLRGHCAMRQDAIGAICPFLDEYDAGRDPDAGWNADAESEPELLASLSDVSPATRLGSPTLWANFADIDELEHCLTTPDYPPPDQIWAGVGPRP
jgi:hypothetical protein